MFDAFFARFQVFSLRALRKEVSGAGAVAAVAAAVGNDRLVTLTKARQHTNTPNTHTLSPHISGVI